LRVKICGTFETEWLSKYERKCKSILTVLKPLQENCCEFCEGCFGACSEKKELRRIYRKIRVDGQMKTLPFVDYTKFRRNEHYTKFIKILSDREEGCIMS